MSSPGLAVCGFGLGHPLCDLSSLCCTGRDEPGGDPMVALTQHSTQREGDRGSSDGKPRGAVGWWHLPCSGRRGAHPQCWLLPITQRCLISQWEAREIMLHGPI